MKIYISALKKELEVFRDLYDARCCRTPCRQMMRNVTKLKILSTLYIIAYLALFIGSLIVISPAPTWGKGIAAILSLSLAAVIISNHIKEMSYKVQRDRDYLEHYRKLESIFLKILGTCRLKQFTNTRELIIELEESVRISVMLIKVVQSADSTDGDNRGGSTEIAEDIPKLRQFVKDTVALIVRLQLMGSNHIDIKGSADMSDEELLDAQAHRLYEMLFENPRFWIR